MRRSTHKLMGITLAALIGIYGAFGIVAAEAKTLKLATDSGAKGSPSGDALKRWGDLITERSNGTIVTQVFYENEMGGQQEIFDLLVDGGVDLMLNWPMTSYDQRLSVFSTPYMISSWEEGLEAYKPGGWINTMLDGIYKDLGLKFFGAWPEGFIGVATRGKYALTEADAKSIKVRVPPISPLPEIMQALGYQTATIEWGEVYTALQTGVVDGDAGNIIYWDYQYFGDILDYVVRVKSNFITGVLTMNLESYESLTPQERKIVEEAALQIMEEQFAAAESTDAGYVKKALVKGMTYIEPSDKVMKEWSAKVRERVWPIMEKKLGKEIMDTIRANAHKY